MPAPGEQHMNAAIPNPFDPPPRRISEYTAFEIATLQSRLDRQLGPEYISARQGPGGGRVHYLAAEKVINLANEVFGFNGWSSSIIKSEIDFIDIPDGTNKVSLGMSVIVRVTLRDGAFHEDVGYGHIENCKGKAAAFEKARKEAVTDALKRALRSFGKVLGNCLYDKDYLREVTKIKIKPMKFDATSLHRHPDYAPVKGEAAANQVHPETPTRKGEHKIDSQISEVEDDFGAGGLFDGVELGAGHRAETPEISQQETRSDPDQNGNRPPARRDRLRMNQQHASSVAPGQRETPSNHESRMMPPPVPAQHARPQPPRTNTAPPSTSISGTTTPHQQDASIVQPQMRPPGNETLQNQPVNTADTSHPLYPDPSTHIDTPGFVTPRAVLATKDETLSDRQIATLPRFNPAAESSSIKRTPGIDHNKSARIERNTVGAPPGPRNAGPPANGQMQPQRRVPTHHQPQATSAALASTQLQVQAPSKNIPSSNFVNPAADPARRIGMPLQRNGSPYRPPSTAGTKRPLPNDASPVGRTPLADVSNAPNTPVRNPSTGTSGTDVKSEDVQIKRTKTDSVPQS